MSDLHFNTLGWTVSSILGDFGPMADHKADKLALIWENGTRTYGALRDRALRLAAALRARGLQTGDRVATVLFNRGEIFELYFACAYAGLVLVPMNFRLSVAEIRMILDDSSARIVFTETELYPTVTEAVAASAGKPEVICLSSADSGPDFERLATEAAPLAIPVAHEIQMILYTSGTTGTPKGAVMRGLSIMWAAFQMSVQFRGLGMDSVMMLNAPMYNTAAMNESSIPTFLVGGTVAIMPSRGWSAERLAELTDKWDVTHSLIFPTMFPKMIEADDRLRLPLDKLRFWYTGGENCPPALMTEVRRRWPHISLAISYGSTESGMATFIENDDILAHPGSVGRRAAGQTIRLLDADFKDVPLGEIGEVWTAGPAVMRNYWNAPDLDAATIRDGWLNIGDLAREDADGYLYIVGRSKDLIISKGQNIYPAEIENVIRQHPAVAEVAVVGIADPESTEAVCACIVPCGEALTEEEIIDFVREHLASYKKPKHVVFLSSFPVRNGTKVDKKELSRICAESAAAKN